MITVFEIRQMVCLDNVWEAVRTFNGELYKTYEEARDRADKLGNEYLAFPALIDVTA
jgi:hypothetical protein